MITLKKGEYIQVNVLLNNFECVNSRATTNSRLA